VPEPCRFCAIVRGQVPASVVLDEDEAVAFLDHRPLFPGHTLVVPRAHHEVLGKLPDAAVEPLFRAVRRIEAAVVAATAAEGSFVACNNRVSQSVPHLHVHVVPRRRGDGLRGFFWPRRRYGDGEAEPVAVAIRAALREAGPHPRQPARTRW
jgi:histidine triad (HIT) family protein